MKKILVCAAIVCAMFASCTPESYFEVENASVENFDANSFTFDKDSEDFNTFWAACQSIIEIHKDFDYFRDLLTDTELEKIDNNTYDVDDAVGIIYKWWLDEETFDVMVEWPSWDDFYVFLPEKYYKIYHFCF